jgi:hypothetical protein
MAAQNAQDKAAADRATAKDETVAGNQQAASQPKTGDSGGAAERSKPLVTDAASPKFSTKPGDVTADPRTGEAFGKVQTAGLKGAKGFENLDAVNVVEGVDPKRIPAEVTPGVTPDPGGDKLLAAAQAKAPSLTKEFVEAMGLTEDQLAQIARGEIPPPPTPGPIHTADMYMTPGGYQQTPPGVPPEDVGNNQMHRL